MPQITDVPPGEVVEELKELRDSLDIVIPVKALDKNLLIATWNLRAFGDITEKWKAGDSDNPKRDFHALRCIAEIISRFDVIAIQEAKSNLKALRYLVKVLGESWGLILSDVTKGAPGNDERLAFLFDTRRLRLSGLACELVVPREKLSKISQDSLDKQFARTPYAVSFQSGKKTFILVTLHVLYGKKADDRVPELKSIAEWLAEWAKDANAWDQNLIALGDFNIDRHGDKLYDAFVSTGLYVPDDMNEIPRTIFGSPKENKFYDQIAWFTGKDGTPALSLEYLRGGSFDFTKIALKSLNVTKNQLSWRISDHYPLWAEFAMRD
ncbi:endonuclease/exonuclease/phosphatase family protein [candidate division WOR-3 bacterium]|nr:endonuclease/exonuclease/phosphatase family protein [candidate division WOR-3 bacterium]